MLSREPYEGPTRKLVLAFDVGTTFSGVSYCILEPGEVPVILGVARYPAQECVGGDSKIPSILYYDLQGDVRAVGAEVLQEHIIEQAEDEGWVKLAWWKLHLRPKHLASSHIREGDIEPLPQGKSAVEVLADFMRYLFQCARTYIQESHLDLWGSIKNSIELVFTHPNGWEGQQQQQIRHAVELAGLISSKEEQLHVHLLTEGEASLHFCVTNVITSDTFSRTPGPIEVPECSDTLFETSIEVSDYSDTFSTTPGPTEVPECSDTFSTTLGPTEVPNYSDEFSRTSIEMSDYCDIFSRAPSPTEVPNYSNTFSRTSIEVSHFSDLLPETPGPTDLEVPDYYGEFSRISIEESDHSDPFPETPGPTSEVPDYYGEFSRTSIEESDHSDPFPETPGPTSEVPDYYGEFSRTSIEESDHSDPFPETPGPTSEVPDYYGEFSRTSIEESDHSDPFPETPGPTEAPNYSDEFSRTSIEESDHSDPFPETPGPTEVPNYSDEFSRASIEMSDYSDDKEDQTDSQGVVIVDAGGGTINLSSYSMKPSATSFKEIAPAECCLQGSVFVTSRARTLLQEKLSGSEHYSNPEIIAQMTETFDNSMKLGFRKPDEPSYTKFGTIRDKDLKYNIQSGQLKLADQDVANLFEPSVEAIIKAFEQQRRAASIPINLVCLVGGFAASDQLFARLQEYFLPLGISFCRPDAHANKVVADGAVSFYIDHLVSSRVARVTYGIECQEQYNFQDPEHLVRQHKAFIDVDGKTYIPERFGSILLKGTQVSEQREFREPFFANRKSLAECKSHSTDIMCYKGTLQDPRWLDTERSSFATLCTIHADLRKLSRTLRPKRSALDQSKYYEFGFDVVMLFGCTELKAQISWKEKGVEMRSPASIVYDDE